MRRALLLSLLLAIKNKIQLPLSAQRAVKVPEDDRFLAYVSPFLDCCYKMPDDG
jgi:hypothetical protein